MKIFEIVQRFELLIKYLNLQNTGDANQLAHKIGISRSQLFNYFRVLKRYGIEVSYDNKSKSYILSSPKEIQFQFPIRILRVSDTKKNNKKADY